MGITNSFPPVVCGNEYLLQDTGSQERPINSYSNFPYYTYKDIHSEDGIWKNIWVNIRKVYA